MVFGGFNGKDLLTSLAVATVLTVWILAYFIYGFDGSDSMDFRLFLGISMVRGFSLFGVCQR